MGEVRQLYRIGLLDPKQPDELNRYLKDIGDRLDELEGRRGQGRFLTIPRSDEGAVKAEELLRLGDEQSLAGKLDKGGDGGLDFAASDITASTLTLTGSTPLTLEDTVWNDIRVPVNSVRIGAAFPPDWENLTDSLYVLAFDNGANNEQVYFTVQVPHTYKIGGEIRAHIHWGPSDAGAGNVIWGLEYSIANVGDVFPSSTTISATVASTGDANDHIQTELGNINVSGITEDVDISTMLICRLFRNSSSGSDTYAADAYLYEIDFHYEIDSLGSNEPLTKVGG